VKGFLNIKKDGGERGHKARFAVGFAPPVGGSVEEPGPALDPVLGRDHLHRQGAVLFKEWWLLLARKGVRQLV